MLNKILPFLAIILLSQLGCKLNIRDVQVYQIQFIELDAKTDVSIRALHVVLEDVVWAGGSKGTVLNSANGGESWNVFQVPGQVENDFRSIYAWDQDKAMVFGVAGPAFGFLTKNGGKTWETVYQDTTKGLFFNTLVFADEKHGLAVSDQVDGKPFVIRTEDGGLNWERIINIPKAKEGEANFAASNTCIAYLPTGQAWMATGGAAARVFNSIDHGVSWKVIDTPMFHKAPSSGIFSIAFKNKMEGVMVGGTYDEPELNSKIAAYTKDGGVSWHPSEKMPKEYRSCVQFISDGKKEYVLAMGKTGCDISSDNGKTWRFLSKKGFYTIRGIPGTLSGYAAGSEGRISKFTIK